MLAFWGNTSTPFPCCDIMASTPAAPSDPNLTAWRPLGLAIPRPAALSLHQGFRDPLRPLRLNGAWGIGVGSGSGADGTQPLEGRIHWFQAADDTLTEWRDDGILFAVPRTNGYVDPLTMAYNASCMSLSGSISTISTVSSWLCVSMHMCGALPCPVCA